MKIWCTFFLVFMLGTEDLLCVDTRQMKFVSVMSKMAISSGGSPKQLMNVECAYYCLKHYPSCTSYVSSVNVTNFVCYGSTRPLNLVPRYTQLTGTTHLYAGCDLGRSYTVHHGVNFKACLSKLQTPQTYTDAAAVCSGMGGCLASAKTSKKAKLLKDIMKQAPVTDLWLGLNDLAMEGNFVWEEDGTPFGSGAGFPGNSFNADCVLLHDTRGLEAADCMKVLSFVCEMMINI